MYRPKPCRSCAMPAPEEELRVLVLNASLKHAAGLSNTGELADLVIENMREHRIVAETVRLADQKLPVGLGFRESPDDDWPGIVERIKNADIVIFATPIWWGGRSSLLQRVIERMDAFDEEAVEGGRSVLLNKVAGVVITGSEDGAQATLGSVMEVLTFMNFTLPPECCAYWVGEVGLDPQTDRKRRLANKSTRHMAASMARNLVFYAQLLRKFPLTPEGEPRDA